MFALPVLGVIMNLPKMYAYRHPEIQTHRPYAFDVDEQGLLWEGQSSSFLYTHNIHTAESQLITLPLSRGRGACDVKCFGDKVIIAVQTGPEYVVYNPHSGTAKCGNIPGKNAQVWYMKKLKDGRLVLFERSESQLIFLESPDEKGRVVKCPYSGEIAGGNVWSDGNLYMSTRHPSRLFCFNLAKNCFAKEIVCPFPNASLSGGVEYNGTVFYSDSASGRMIPFHLDTHSWGDPIPVPWHGKLFGFMGGCTTFQGKGYFSTSTYAYPSTLDTKTGKVITVDLISGKKIPPEKANIGVDGKPHRFQGFQIVFDPESQSFDRLQAPRQKDGHPLLCYQWSNEEYFFISGYIIPFDDSGEAGKEKGDWLILQNIKAEE